MENFNEDLVNKYYATCRDLMTGIFYRYSSQVYFPYMFIMCVINKAKKFKPDIIEMLKNLICKSYDIATIVDSTGGFLLRSQTIYW